MCELLYHTKYTSQTSALTWIVVLTVVGFMYKDNLMTQKVYAMVIDMIQ